MIDKSMFCHPQTQLCVLACSTDADCPAPGSCDDREEAKAGSGDRSYCVAPSCSAGSKVATVSHVGDRRLPASIPENGFDDCEAYVATSDNEDCGGGVCLVYHLRGYSRAACVADPQSDYVCADRNELEDRVYCSCRCDAPEGYAECACPDGFACQDVLDQGGANVAGGYCVREGT